MWQPAAVGREAGTLSYVTCKYRLFTRDTYTIHKESYWIVTEILVKGDVGEGVEVAFFPDPLCYKSLRYSRMMEGKRIKGGSPEDGRDTVSPSDQSKTKAVQS